MRKGSTDLEIERRRSSLSSLPSRSLDQDKRKRRRERDSNIMGRLDTMLWTRIGVEGKNHKGERQELTNREDLREELTSTPPPETRRDTPPLCPLSTPSPRFERPTLPSTSR